tara:strand:- start:38 stop:283 length:246 start_codon:yes stop_codon:yes gene_type:complete
VSDANEHPFKDLGVSISNALLSAGIRSRRDMSKFIENGGRIEELPSIGNKGALEVYIWFIKSRIMAAPKISDAEYKSAQRG